MQSYDFPKAMRAQPSAMIRSDYNTFSKMCHDLGEPILVTRNGESDLVVMSHEAYNTMIARVSLTLELMAADHELQAGTPTIPAQEVFASLREAIHENAQD